MSWKKWKQKIKLLAIRPFAKNIFIANDTNKFVGKSLMIKQADLKKLLDDLVNSSSSSSSSSSSDEEDEH